MTGAAPALRWPVGEPASERDGTGLPQRWTIAVGYDQEYDLAPVGGHATRAVHTGLDLSIPGEADYGAACYAVAPGTVTYAGPAPGSWGNVVLLHHANVPGLGELWSQYAHLATVEVRIGQVLDQSQRLGTVGNAGRRFSAHLHFELRRQNLPADYWPSAGRRSLAQAHDIVRRAYVNPWGLLGQ